jgi:hypothetical protein
MGLGANIEDVRFVVLDASAFRAISGFNPGEITPQAFERARAEERLALILQNLGRAVRGEADKTAVLIILNGDPELEWAIRGSRALIEGSEVPPAFARGKDLVALVDQARRWLAAGGGDWPEADTGMAEPSRRGRRKGSTKWTAESMTREAEVAAASGMSWTEFSRKYHPRRVLGEEELEEIKPLFSGNMAEDAVELAPEESLDGSRTSGSRKRRSVAKKTS